MPHTFFNAEDDCQCQCQCQSWIYRPYSADQ